MSLPLRSAILGSVLLAGLLASITILNDHADLYDFRSAFTGFFGNRFLIQMARKNGGLMQAEHRLWLFLASLILIPFGCILWGVGAYHHIHWFGLVFAMGTISFTTTAGSQISVAYTVDCYRDLAGEALVTVIIIRNTMSFGIGYGYVVHPSFAPLSVIMRTNRLGQPVRRSHTNIGTESLPGWSIWDTRTRSSSVHVPLSRTH